MTSNSSEAQLQQLGNECIQHLERECANLESFVKICDEIQNTLGTGDQEANNRLMQQQQEIENRIAETSQSRETLRVEIARQLQLPEASATIREVQSLLPQEQGDKISNLRSEIESRVDSIRALTNTNNLLLQQTIDIYQRMMMSLSGTEERSKTYTSSGQLRARIGNNVVIDNVRN